VNEPAAILRRKDEHLDLALRQNLARQQSLFDTFRLEPCALPELTLDEVDLSTRFLGFDLRAPLLISSMTGGPRRGAEINARLAEAAAALGIGLAVGSQRVALEGAGSAGIDDTLRRMAPGVLLLANLGGAQLIQPGGVAEARRAVEMIQADGLIVHLNPLQEAVQPAGDTNWNGVLSAIADLVRTLDRPVVVKEVGYGISGDVARRLRDVGVAAIDVAGRGGTAWALIEAERAGSPADAAVGTAFADWGIPTPLAIREVRRACPDAPLIASGGVRDGVDAAKALRLGADLVGQAGGVLQAALTSTEAVVSHFEIMIRQLRIACFCTGARDLATLRNVRLLPDALPLHDL
jgi:isopentenyl-diphosphate delta-isomerase